MHMCAYQIWSSTLHGTSVWKGKLSNLKKLQVFPFTIHNEILDLFLPTLTSKGHPSLTATSPTFDTGLARSGVKGPLMRGWSCVWKVAEENAYIGEIKQLVLTTTTKVFIGTILASILSEEYDDINRTPGYQVKIHHFVQLFIVFFRAVSRLKSAKYICRMHNKCSKALILCINCILRSLWKHLIKTK